jgi:tetratricopeptide (TPR) repeat protein
MASRKEKIAELTADDPFLEAANKGAEWVHKNGKILAAGAGGFLALAAAILFIGERQDRNASVVTMELLEALEPYEDAIEEQQRATATATAAPHEKKLREASEKLGKIVESNADHGAANLARLYKADAERRLGNWDQAKQLYLAYLERAPKDDVLRFLAHEGAGYAAEEQQKYDEAIEHFTKLVELPNKFYEDYAYKHLGRVHELKGDKAKALEHYKKIVDELPDSKIRDFAEERVNALD